MKKRKIEERACKAIARFYLAELAKKRKKYAMLKDVYFFVETIVGHPLTPHEKNEVRWGFDDARKDGAIAKSGVRGKWSFNY